MAPGFPPGRLGRALAALAVAAGAGGWAAARIGGPAGGPGLLVGLAVALLAGGLVTRRVGPVALSVMGLSTVYLIGQIGRPTAVGATALFAVALLVVLELGWWSTDLAVPVAWDRSASRGRWWALIALAAGGGALALAVGLAGVAGRDAGLAWFALAAGVGPAAVWVVARATKAATRR